MSEQQSPENDAACAEWIVALNRDHHDASWLSLHQCPVCFALVVEDFMPEHEEWHARVVPPGFVDGDVRLDEIEADLNRDIPPGVPTSPAVATEGDGGEGRGDA